MYISHIALENYAGIYSGTGKKSISIDFPNPEEMNSKIVLLLGGNGSGKSTLMSTLHPFAESFDARDDLIMKSEEEGKKEIHFSDKKGLRYIIQHFYSRNKKGGIKTKSFIQKFDNKKTGVELNENGGVTTFKQKIFEEFRLNSDYFKIGRLASQTANFTSLQTAQRKDFVIQYLPNSEPYLEAYRNAKDKLNEIKEKIDYLAKSLNDLGKREDIVERVNLLQKQFDLVKNQMNEFDAIVKQKVKEVEKLKSSKEFIEINKMIEQKNLLENQLEKLDKEFSLASRDYKFDPKKLFDDSEITLAMEKLASNSKKSEVANAKKDSLIKDLKRVNDEIAKEESSLDDKTHQLKDYSEVDMSLEELNEVKESNDKELEKSKEDFERIGQLKFINRFNKLSEEYNILIPYSSYEQIRMCMMDFSRLLQVFHSDRVVEITEEEFDQIRGYKDFNKDYAISVLKNSIKKNNEEIENKKRELIAMESKYVDALIGLEKRPDDCTNNNCFFVKAYIANSSEETKNKMNTIKKDIEKLNDKLKELNDKFDKLTFVCKVIHSLEEIDKLTLSFSKHVNNFYITVMVKTVTREMGIIDFLLSSKGNEDIIKAFVTRTDKIFEYLYAKESIKRIEKDNEKITLQIKSITNNSKFIKTLKVEIESLKESISKHKEEFTKINEELAVAKADSARFSMYVAAIESYIENRREKEEIKKELDNIEKKLDKNKEIREEIEKANEEMQKAKDKFDEIKKEYEEVESDLVNSKATLSKYDTFDKNYKEAIENSKKIDVVVNSCDPKKGIPLAFMQEFLNSTSEFANELFDMAYQGKFRINFEVTEKDFNIPVLKEDGSLLKDIKEASDGESSLIRTIISLALLSRYNSIFPIMCLDEVDGCLDDKYRSSFAEIIEGQIEVLNLEQIFMISHNENFRNEDIPVILFPRNTFNKGEKNHVIWSYDK